MALLALFPIINPVGAVASFATTYRRPAQERTPLSGAVHIPVCVRHIGGVYHPRLVHSRHVPPGTARHSNRRWFVVAHSGYRMLVPASDHGDPEAHQDNDIAFTPMALPLIAGPSAIGEVIGLSARYTEPRERLAILIAVLVISIVIMALLRAGAHHWYINWGPAASRAYAHYGFYYPVHRRRTDDPRSQHPRHRIISFPLRYQEGPAESICRTL